MKAEGKGASHNAWGKFLQIARRNLAFTIKSSYLYAQVDRKVILEILPNEKLYLFLSLVGFKIIITEREVLNFNYIENVTYIIINQIVL